VTFVPRSEEVLAQIARVHGACGAEEVVCPCGQCLAVVCPECAEALEIAWTVECEHVRRIRPLLEGP
jgi:hypothetical protein